MGPTLGDGGQSLAVRLKGYGRCVVAAAPAASLAYVRAGDDYRAHRAALIGIEKPSWACERRNRASGVLGYEPNRLAALTDALRERGINPRASAPTIGGEAAR